jgi:hypothetical protein
MTTQHMNCYVVDNIIALQRQNNVVLDDRTINLKEILCHLLVKDIDDVTIVLVGSSLLAVFCLFLVIIY